jgi:hypothetical protein
MGGPLRYEMNEGLITPPYRKRAYYGMIHRISDLDGFFGTTGG